MMTFAEKEEWLNRAYELSKEQPFLVEEYNEMMRRYDKCTDISSGQQGSGKSHSGNGTESKYVSYASTADEYEKALRQAIETYRATKAEIRAAIATLDNPAERAVLTARYLRFKSIPEIVKKTHYSTSYVKTLKRRGIEHIRIK